MNFHVFVFSGRGAKLGPSCAITFLIFETVLFFIVIKESFEFKCFLRSSILMFKSRYLNGFLMFTCYKIMQNVKGFASGFNKTFFQLTYVDIKLKAFILFPNSLQLISLLDLLKKGSIQFERRKMTHNTSFLPRLFINLNLKCNHKTLY